MVFAHLLRSRCRVRESLNNLLRGAIAASRGARSLAYLFDMSQLLRAAKQVPLGGAVLLALASLVTVLQRFLSVYERNGVAMNPAIKT